jgi:hypothetical protein
MKNRQSIQKLAVSIAISLIAASVSHGALPGAVPLAPGDTVTPADLTGVDPGTLLATLSSPFTTVDTSGTLFSSVYRESGGTLDFYYQIQLSGNSSGDISRETNTSFAGYQTSVGYRPDGSALSGSPFTNGTVAPTTADRNAGGDVVGFNFGPPESAKVLPGQTSDVLVISTNATTFTTGSSSVIDGGAGTVQTFEPTVVPEPSTLAQLVLGVIALATLWIRPRKRA